MGGGGGEWGGADEFAGWVCVFDRCGQRAQSGAVHGLCGAEAVRVYSAAGARVGCGCCGRESLDEAGSARSRSEGGEGGGEA